MSLAAATWPLLTATAGLLAFLIGVYTLVGRDRKSPYLINSVFAVFLICMLGAALDVAALLVEPLGHGVSDALRIAGMLAVLAAVIVTMWRLWTIYIRFAYFVDPGGRARLKLCLSIGKYGLSARKRAGPAPSTIRYR